MKKKKRRRRRRGIRGRRSDRVFIVTRGRIPVAGEVYQDPGVRLWKSDKERDRASFKAAKGSGRFRIISVRVGITIWLTICPLCA